MRKLPTVLSIIALLVIGGLVYLYLRDKTPDEPIYCTQDAKLCPDGSYVGRTGPKCEFAACPISATTTWPASLGTTYVGTVDWPPQLQILSQPYSCNPAGTNEAPPGGMTGKVVVNGHEYCVTRESQGAAGTKYTMFAYAFPRGNQTYIYTFSLKYPQCGNYPDPERIKCQNEQNSFDIGLNDLIDRVAQPQR